MDELWQEFCNGIASFLGGLVARALFTKEGLQVAGCVLAGGVVLAFYYSDLSPAESEARSIVKYQCRNAWSFYYTNGRMPPTGINLANNSTYNFGVVPTRHYNVSIIAAQSIKSDFSKGYACMICKSNSYSNRNISPVSTSGGLGCPNGYRHVETIKP
jgi:hypothetical protein